MQKINFENLPSTNTPINATNLNAIQDNAENEINSLRNDFSKKIIQMIKSENTDDYTTSFNNFSPFNGDTLATSEISTTDKLIFEKKPVSYGDRTNNNVWGFTIGSNINLIKVNFSVRYLNNSDSEVQLNTIINKFSDDNNNELYSTSKSVSSNNRFTDNGSFIFKVKEGDFIFLSTWKGTKTADIDVISLYNVTNMSIEVIN